MKPAKLASLILATALFGAAAATPATANSKDYRPSGSIGQLYYSNAEVRNWLGAPTSGEIPVGPGVYQRFENGTIYNSPTWGAHPTSNGDIQARFLSGGGATGELGFPTTSKRPFAGGWVQGFANADVMWGPGIGAKVVGHDTYRKWSTNPGLLGWAVRDETRTAQGKTIQEFERGSMAWTKAQGAHPAQGAIGDRWRESGGKDSPHGNPISDEIGGWRNGGIFQVFEHGWIYFSPATGPHSVWGAIGALWAQMGREAGPLGYPTSEETRAGEGVFQRFEHGTVFHSPATGTYMTTSGEFQNRFVAGGGAEGELGYPTGNKTPFAGGYVQSFAKGDITWGPGIGARVLGHGIYQKWAANPGQFGWALTDEWQDRRGARVQFQHREVIWDFATAELYSAEPVDASTVVFLGDSQLAGPGIDSWAEQAAQKLGLTHQIEHVFGGLGYTSGNIYAGGNAEQALMNDRVLLPQGRPGAIILTLGGNDATTGASDAAILEAAKNTWDELARKYPHTKIIVNGVMSRNDASHTRRRQVDALIVNAAKARGLQTISVTGMASTAGADPDFHDNVHLTQAGHNKVTASYLPLLKAALSH
ncbi:GDSL-type esterase/lipase family protein [Paenarthrobacter sp. NPDC057355]|uniref:GDSL-type esterase/lipase family protein n=1 Tax=Paenarthrobacter sp. NPDC057355 TaxID=3346105 RepID=UPI0036268DEF